MSTSQRAARHGGREKERGQRERERERERTKRERDIRLLIVANGFFRSFAQVELIKVSPTATVDSDRQSVRVDWESKRERERAH
jgi:hypothetical protein